MIMVKRSVFGGILATAGLFVLQSSALTFAETTGSATFSVDIADTILELSVPSNPAVINLNPTMTGTAFGTANVTISAATNNQTGYTITMTPDSYYSDVALVRTELVGDEEDYRRIEALEPTTPASTGYTEETFTSNTWGYRILNNTNYYGIDENNPTISHPAWTTDAPTNGTNHNLTVAAKVDSGTVSGSYATTLVFTATTNAVVAKDTVTFNGNGADNADAMANVVLQVPSGESTTLPANLYARDGYSFVGWSTVASGSGGMVYIDQGQYNSISTDYSHQITLYAQWRPSSIPGGYCDLMPDECSGSVEGVTFTRAYEIAYTAMHKGMYEEQHEGQGDYALVNSWPPTSEPYKNYDVRFAMQDMTPEICASVTVMHDDYQALDIRDNKLYHITKMADGKCWMTQNLDLELTHYASDADATLTHANTDLGWTTNDPTVKWNPTYSSYTLAIDGGIPRDVYSSGTYTPASLDPGDAYIVPASGGGADTVYKSLNECVEGTQMPADSYCSHYHVGNYYNWSAAVAENNSEYEAITTPWSYAPNSVCPAGWRLPRGAQSSPATQETADEINISMIKSGMLDQPRYIIGNWSISQDTYNTFRSNPFYIVRNGYYSLDYIENLGQTTMSWTASTNWRGDIGSAFEIGVGTWTGPQVYISQFDSKNRPMTIRCVAR